MLLRCDVLVAILGTVCAACASSDPPEPATTAAASEARMIQSNGFPSAMQGWANRPVPLQIGNAGPITIEFDAKPSSSSGAAIDAVIGFTDRAADDFSALGPIVRFNAQGMIDVRNGDVYAADAPFPYALLTEYHVRFVIDLPAKRYSVFVRQRFGDFPEIQIAHDYAFRTERNTLALIDTMAGIVDSASGALSWANVDVFPEICHSPAPGWTALPFPTQTGTFQVVFDATPSAPGGSAATTIDAVVGLSRFAPHAFADLAANIRFNTSGHIDMRNGESYVADQPIPYVLDHTYRFLLEVNHTAKTYSASVSDLISPFVSRTIGRDLRFRIEQSTVVTLGWEGGFIDGPGCCMRVCNLMVWND